MTWPRTMDRLLMALPTTTASWAIWHRMTGTANGMTTYNGEADDDITGNGLADNGVANKGVADNIVTTLSLPTMTASWAMGAASDMTT